MHKILFLSRNAFKFRHSDFLNDDHRYTTVDIALDTAIAQRLLLRNSTFYSSIVIDCRELSQDDLYEFISFVREKISPVLPKIVVTNCTLVEKNLIHFGVDQIIDGDVKDWDFEAYPELSEISSMAYIEFLIQIIRTKDKALYDHMKGVKTFTTLLTKLCFQENLIDFKTLEDTVFASFFHDIGKLFIPESILHKPSSLTKEEFEFMKQHTTLGASLFEKILRTNPENRTFTTLYHVTKYHHERYDGKGYPCGLTGEQIPIGARIVAVTDVFQALVADRSYRNAYDFDKAVQIIEEDEGHFDPQIVQILLENIDLFKL